MERVELPRSIVVELLRQAQQSPDAEICGLITAVDDRPVRVIQIRNTAAEPRRLFDMDERQLIDAMKQVRERGETLFAIFHSHPDAKPVPSRNDIERLGYPETLHLIISLHTKGVLQMRGWRLDSAEPRALEVGVQENT